jgi:hypothetical protein
MSRAAGTRLARLSGEQVVYPLNAAWVGALGLPGQFREAIVEFQPIFPLSLSTQRGRNEQCFFGAY